MGRGEVEDNNDGEGSPRRRRGCASWMNKTKKWMRGVRGRGTNFLTVYKRVDKTADPVPGVTPECAKTVCGFPSNPLCTLSHVPSEEKPRKDGQRVTRTRLDHLKLNAGGFLPAHGGSSFRIYLIY
ncbi:hypothetical protein PIIN_10035 [Serendipita indica DSM 11827]|uniref:Uncharacterized protein n=1 Tax=Serendipita indica (strain DSM 11827) TaxID=1109443 RepID=G4TXJ2_SERID|nr:hypothetical protein PIIN_10035 [Serendipita indica DSM 11827]